MNGHKLNSQIVDLWLDDLSCKSLQDLLQDISLSDEEQQKADSFYFSEHRHYYVLAHKYLRWVLSQYLGVEPDIIAFTKNIFGKPELVKNQNALSLQFNLSHSDNFIAVGIGKTHTLGVDIETIKNDIEITTLAAHCFSTKEVEYFSTIMANQQKPEFYYHWSRKEAYLKALGTGLNTPTTSFSIDLEPINNPTPVIDPSRQDTEWKIWTIDAKLPKCACAIATENKITSIIVQPRYQQNDHANPYH